MADVSSTWAKYLEPILKEAIHDGYTEHPDSTGQIFRIDEDTSGIIRVHDSWGPSGIPTSSENAASAELARVKGLNFLVLVKSLLINGENLRQNAMATLSKQAIKIAVQLQRLSVETPKFGEATV